MAPVIGQLTDDNGDGVIDSGDMPDIVIVTDDAGVDSVPLGTFASSLAMAVQFVRWTIGIPQKDRLLLIVTATWPWGISTGTEYPKLPWSCCPIMIAEDPTKIPPFFHQARPRVATPERGVQWECFDPMESYCGRT